MTLTFLECVYQSHCHSSDALYVDWFNTSLCAFITFVSQGDSEKDTITLFQNSLSFYWSCNTLELESLSKKSKLNHDEWISIRRYGVEYYEKGFS